MHQHLLAALQAIAALFLVSGSALTTGNTVVRGNASAALADSRKDEESVSYFMLRGM